MNMTETTYRSYPCVGTVGRGLFPADFAHDGKPVLFSGAIRVHRVGGLEEPGRRFYFECFGKGWAGGYLSDPASARWFDAQGNPAVPVTSEGVGLATEDDYYKVILPALKRLERSLSAEANAEELEPIRGGLVDCWQYRRTEG